MIELRNGERNKYRIGYHNHLSACMVQLRKLRADIAMRMISMLVETNYNNNVSDARCYGKQDVYLISKYYIIVLVTFNVKLKKCVQ